MNVEKSFADKNRKSCVFEIEFQNFPRMFFVEKVRNLQIVKLQ